jgi:hypothetical protein
MHFTTVYHDKFPLILGLLVFRTCNTSQVVMSTIPKRKYKRSDIEANYRNETKTF